MRKVENYSLLEVKRKESLLKRPFDVSLSLIGVIVSLPLWILFGLIILIKDGWPVFFVQERVGKNGKKFKAYKFRSMIKDAENEIDPVQAEDDSRITKIGKIMRATAMDELPQLVNILKGDMSFVGPRAMRSHEIENGNRINEEKNPKPENKYRKKDTGNCEERISSQKSVVCKNRVIPLKKVPGYSERQSVRPGLTGFAQIFLPKESPLREKFLYDLAYVKNQSFWFDLKLIFLSFWVTFRGKWETRDKKI